MTFKMAITRYYEFVERKGTYSLGEIWARWGKPGTPPEITQSLYLESLIDRQAAGDRLNELPKSLLEFLSFIEQEIAEQILGEDYFD